MLGLPALEPRYRADPQRPRTLEGQSVDPVVDQRTRVTRIVTPVFEAAGCRLEHVETVVGSSDPHPISGIHHHGVHGVAGERAGIVGIVAVDGEAVGGAPPAGQAAVLDGDPQIALRVLDGLPGLRE